MGHLTDLPSYIERVGKLSGKRDLHYISYVEGDLVATLVLVW